MDLKPKMCEVFGKIMTEMMEADFDVNPIPGLPICVEPTGLPRNLWDPANPDNAEPPCIPPRSLSVHTKLKKLPRIHIIQ